MKDSELIGGVFYCLLCCYGWFCVAISQRDVSSYYPHLDNIKDQLSTELINFFSSKLSKKFSLENCKYFAAS